MDKNDPMPEKIKIKGVTYLWSGQRNIYYRVCILGELYEYNVKSGMIHRIQ